MASHCHLKRWFDIDDRNSRYRYCWLLCLLFWGFGTETFPGRSFGKNVNVGCCFFYFGVLGTRRSPDVLFARTLIYTISVSTWFIGGVACIVSCETFYVDRFWAPWLSKGNSTTGRVSIVVMDTFSVVEFLVHSFLWRDRASQPNFENWGWNRLARRMRINFFLWGRIRSGGWWGGGVGNDLLKVALVTVGYV